MEAMTPERVEITDHLPVVRDTIADVHRRFGEWVELGELLSEAALWWYSDSAQKHLPEYLADAHMTRLRRSIWRWCARYAEREKAQAIGYRPGDQYRYSVPEILALIRVALDPDGLPQQAAHEEGPKPTGNLAEGGDALAALFDVRRALGALAEDDLHFLVLAEDLERDWERVSRHTDTLPDSTRRRHARIAERMARWLNKEDYA